MRSLPPDSPALPADALLRAARVRGWRGRDPYDALASPLGRAVCVLGPPARYALTQASLRLPLVRSLAAAPPLLNPKALALFLGASARASAGETPRPGHPALELLRLLSESQCPGGGWGYPFPWQSRYFWAPAGMMNAVVTATVGWMACEAADRLSVPDAGALGRESCDQLFTRLQRTCVGSGIAISYTPGDRTRVVNISALAARVLARAGEERAEARGLASELTTFVLATQRPDGSWPYALDAGAEWEDSFHTGYILEAMIDVDRYGIEIPRDALARGFEAYRRFFDDDGAARLRPDAASPLDAHSAAQGILTYLRLEESRYREIAGRERAAERAAEIARWAMANLYLPDEERFAYRIVSGRADRRNFLRWVQAWMALALATLAAFEAAAEGHAVHEPRRATS